MELKDFVRVALADITAGVASAREELGDAVAIATTDQTNIPTALQPNMFIDCNARMYSVVDSR